MLRWLIGLLLLVFSLYVCICNVAIVCLSVFRQERHSLVLFVGGIAGMLGLLVLPGSTHGLFWVPVVADVGIPYLFAAGLVLAKKASRGH